MAFTTLLLYSDVTVALGWSFPTPPYLKQTRMEEFYYEVKIHRSCPRKDGQQFLDADPAGAYQLTATAR